MTPEFQESNTHKCKEQDLNIIETTEQKLTQAPAMSSEMHKDKEATMEEVGKLFKCMKIHKFINFNILKKIAVHLICETD